MHYWRHHYKVFPLCFKMAERIKIIFYVIERKISTNKYCGGFEQVREVLSPAGKRKILKAVSFLENG